jgi:hypothetical protein
MSVRQVLVDYFQLFAGVSVANGTRVEDILPDDVAVADMIIHVEAEYDNVDLEIEAFDECINFADVVEVVEDVVIV